MQKDMFNVVDELLGPLNAHISSLLSQPVTGTDDGVTHVETKRSYLGLLTGVISSGLQGVFISERELISEPPWWAGASQFSRLQVIRTHSNHFLKTCVR